MQWVAEAIDWLSQKQLYFENNLKAGPNYDPLYYDLSVRDNPELDRGPVGFILFRSDRAASDRRRLGFVFRLD